MKIAVIGTDINLDEKLVIEFLLECHEFDTEYDKIISGGTSGVERSAINFAKKYNLKNSIYKPNWYKYGLQALKIRNSDLINACDKLIYFYKDRNDIREDIELADQLGKPHNEYNVILDRKFFSESNHKLI